MSLIIKSLYHQVAHGRLDSNCRLHIILTEHSEEVRNLSKQCGGHSFLVCNGQSYISASQTCILFMT